MYRELYGDFADWFKGAKGWEWCPSYGKVFLWCFALSKCSCQEIKLHAPFKPFFGFVTKLVFWRKLCLPSQRRGTKEINQTQECTFNLVEFIFHGQGTGTLQWIKSLRTVFTRQKVPGFSRWFMFHPRELHVDVNGCQVRGIGVKHQPCRTIELS